MPHTWVKIMQANCKGAIGIAAVGLLRGGLRMVMVGEEGAEGAGHGRKRLI